MLPSSRATLRACTPFVAALALALGGCGGEAKSSNTTSGGGDTSDEGRAKLTQCLRDNGVDVPDNPGGGGAGAGGPQDIDREKMQEAMEGPCKEYQAGAFGNASEEDRQEMQDAFQKFSQCMRDEGIDMPDAAPGSGGGPPAGGGNQIDRDDPKVQAAMKACQDELPQGRGPGGQ